MANLRRLRFVSHFFALPRDNPELLQAQCAALRTQVPLLFFAVERFCRGYDEFRDFLRPRTRHNQPVPASRRRLLHLRRATAALAILAAA